MCNQPPVAAVRQELTLYILYNDNFLQDVA